MYYLRTVGVLPYVCEPMGCSVKPRESKMKKAAGLVGVLAVVAVGLLLFCDSSVDNNSESESPEMAAETQRQIEQYEPSELASEDLSFTRDEFDQLPVEQQDEMLEEFVLEFWKKEMGLSEEDGTNEHLSLEIFDRPYMLTLTEREIFQLSAEDREKAMAEVMEDCPQVRSYVHKAIAEAESRMAEKDYANAEAYFIHGLETGRELSVNREGLIIVRLVGIACEKLALNGLVKLYEQTGDNSKAQMVRQELSEIEKEVEEIKRMAREAEKGR